jgi:AraC-like DNA-binding protein
MAVPKSRGDESPAIRTAPQLELPVLVTSAEYLARAVPAPSGRRQRIAQWATRHVLIVPSSGVGRHVVDFVEIEVGEDRVVHVQPGQIHAFLPELTYCADVVVVDPAACPTGLFDPSIASPSVALGSAAGLVRSLTADLVAEQSRPDRSDDIMIATVGLLFRHIARLGPAGDDRRPELLRAFLADLEQRFSDTRNVADYARSIGTSTKTLARLTASAVNLTPKDIIDRRVALEARRCLAVDKTPIADVGQALGFSEATNFTKFFARMEGMTPHEFRTRFA